MSDLDTHRLRMLALAVPHGPWTAGGGYPQRITNDGALLIADVFENPDMAPTISEYIAALDPDTVLALLDAVSPANEAKP